MTFSPVTSTTPAISQCSVAGNSGGEVGNITPADPVVDRIDAARRDFDAQLIRSRPRDFDGTFGERLRTIVFLLIGWVMGAIANGNVSHRETMLSFAATVLPIATVYEITHNYVYVASNLGRLAALLQSAVTGAPFDPIAPLGWLGLEAFWESQVLLIVAGHVIAVVAAHRVALAHSHSTSDARRLHVPLVVLMIGYTVLSLWIISQPVVTG